MQFAGDSPVEYLLNLAYQFALYLPTTISKSSLPCKVLIPLGSVRGTVRRRRTHSSEGLRLRQTLKEMPQAKEKASVTLPDLCGEIFVLSRRRPRLGSGHLPLERVTMMRILYRSPRSAGRRPKNKE